MATITQAGFYGGRYLRVGTEVPDAIIAAALPPAEATPDLDSMTKVELLAEAERRGVSVKESDTKAEIIAALQA
ncbi:hypothetical protein [Ancylobacter sp. SL191]|uniref:hypothetical protein n=1 Tax=Ancylobacter sp. SL191 TaxID=2995166 RepID=UPI002271516E|nr:hypothetical protein [Ancylobacter sp. SL191]WAC26419.1 hypothetical protein OU996_15540 [Ancylobacter sp. SL191]